MGLRNAFLACLSPVIFTGAQINNASLKAEFEFFDSERQKNFLLSFNRGELDQLIANTRYGSTHIGRIRFQHGAYVPARLVRDLRFRLACMESDQLYAPSP